jgi:hypothetical protein
VGKHKENTERPNGEALWLKNRLKASHPLYLTLGLVQFFNLRESSPGILRRIEKILCRRKSAGSGDLYE